MTERDGDDAIMRKINCIKRANTCFIALTNVPGGSGVKIFEYNKVDNCFYWVEGIKSYENTIAVPNLVDISEEEEFQYMLVHDDSFGLTYKEMKEVQRQMISCMNISKHFLQNIHPIYV